MSLFDRKIFSEKKIGKEIYFILPVVFWFVFIMISLLWNLNIVEKSIEQSLLSVGRSFFREIINTRLWNSMHGGVYVPVTEKTLPNKYLEDKDRDVVTLSGLHLTKVNPAYMTRQIGEIARLYSHIVYHITSLNPIRPGNKARDWEVIALNSFVKGKKEYFRLDDKKEVYLYMAPLITGESCIKCHAKQGYKIGDIRGGISVGIPVKEYSKVIINFKKSIFTFLYLWDQLFLKTAIRAEQAGEYIKILKNNEIHGRKLAIVSTFEGQ
ncbi:MAG: DUF3365 domain-containing protein [Desulfobacteraceae bacterium]|nr:DUF3365 domain-containing protein [Desulfobacteraceae bacterium]